MSQKGLAPILIVIILAAALVGGYLVFTSYSNNRTKLTQVPTNLPPLVSTEQGHPKLASSLYQLVQSKNRQEFAKTHGLDLINNQVTVVIELTNDNYSLPTKFGVLESKAQKLLQARVFIDKLLELVDDPNIKSIRSPVEPILLSPQKKD